MYCVKCYLYDMANRSLFNFFKYQALGFIICALRVAYDVKDIADFLWNLFILFILCNIISCWTGIASMIGTDLYIYIKKNLKNEIRLGYLLGLHYRSS